MISKLRTALPFAFRRAATAQVIGAVAVIALCGCCSCPKPNSAREIRALVAELDNSDVEWDGNFVGLYFKLSGATAELMQHTELLSATPLLMESADSPSKFVASHILLVTIDHQIRNRTANAKDIADEKQWYGLKVSLKADGSTHCHKKNSKGEPLSFKSTAPPRKTQSP